MRTIDREKWQARVIALLLTRPDTGATADEAAAHFGVAHNTVAPRFSELKRDGKILPLVYEGVKIRRLTRAGCKSQVFVAAKGAKQ